MKEMIQEHMTDITELAVGLWPYSIAALTLILSIIVVI